MDSGGERPGRPGAAEADIERALALRANVAEYNESEERRYVRGAPHVKHASLRRIYEKLAAEALASIPPRNPLEVLDLGAGSGLASTFWFKDAVHLTAVDSSQSMLKRLRERRRAEGGDITTVLADIQDFLDHSPDHFDIVTHVSTLHHVPNYLDLIVRSSAMLRPGGSLLTFQDPLRYDRVGVGAHTAARLAYFAWRICQGNYRQGARTRWRRATGIYDPGEIADYGEYHVVRGGVDSTAIADLLTRSFENVRVISYWSTQSALLQGIGERMRLHSSFGIMATGKRI